MGEYEIFKTTLVGGYDKEDVMIRIQNIKEEAYAEQKRLNKELQEKEKHIEDLEKRLKEKEEKVENLEREIGEKYQKYADNYNNIGKLVFDAQIKADLIIAEAKEKADAMLAVSKEQGKMIERKTKEESERVLRGVEVEVDAKLAEGKRKYKEIQEELTDIIKTVNLAQNKFMSAYKEIHQIMNHLPGTFEEEVEEELQYSDIVKKTEEERLKNEEFPDDLIEQRAETADWQLVEENLSEEEDKNSTKEESKEVVKEEEEEGSSLDEQLKKLFGAQG
ncbi:MAG TPA: hypothetical protein VIR32_10660 [Lachnospiraceae bacterium]